MADEHSTPATGAGEDVPAAAPQPAAGMGTMSTADEEPGLSGWLVMWGPLIILGLLVFVFAGKQRELPLPVAVIDSSEPASPAIVTEVPSPAPMLPEVVESQTGSELADAFKAAGLPLPEEAPPAPGLPSDLYGNPWAPEAGAGAAPTPPAFSTFPPLGPYGGYPMPPPGYGYGYGYGPNPYAPQHMGPGGYGMGYGRGGWGAMPPGYGPMPYYGYGMPHQGPNFRPQGGGAGAQGSHPPGMIPAVPDAAGAPDIVIPPPAPPKQ